MLVKFRHPLNIVLEFICNSILPYIINPIGVLLSEIVNHTKSKVSGDLDPRMKIYMYSAVSILERVNEVYRDLFESL